MTTSLGGFHGQSVQEVYLMDEAAQGLLRRRFLLAKSNGSF